LSQTLTEDFISIQKFIDPNHLILTFNL